MSTHTRFGFHVIRVLLTLRISDYEAQILAIHVVLICSWWICLVPIFIAAKKCRFGTENFMTRDYHRLFKIIVEKNLQNSVVQKLRIIIDYSCQFERGKRLK
jgi:hypothetical protein